MVNERDIDCIGRRAARIAAAPEISAFGLRNPWRYSFDDLARGGTGALLIGDVGPDAVSAP